MSDLHERFDALVATLEKSLSISLDHVKDAPAEAAPAEAAARPAEPAAPVEPAPAAETPAA